MSTEPLVSIIIVNYNGKTCLESCLESLSEIHYKHFEIMIVDNNSQDGSMDFVKNRYPSINVIKLDKNYGFAYPNNIGAKSAKGELLLFLNNDTQVRPEFVTELVKVLTQHPRVAICQSLLLKPNGEVDSSGDFVDVSGIAYSSKEKIPEVREILSAKAASMMMRKDVFEKLGGFDEKFYTSFEDVDLGWRSWIAGYKVVVVPTSIVYHTGGQTIQKFKSEISFHGIKNQLTMKITNFENYNMVRSLVLFFVVYGFRILRIFFDYKLHGRTTITSTKYEKKIAQKPDFKVICKAFAWVFINQSYLRRKHKQVNSTRVNSTADLIRLNIIKK